MAITDKPSDYFNSVLYTGNAGTQSITGVGFQPDFFWGKSRSGTKNNALHDSVRGVTKRLISNSTALELAVATSVTAFGSDGFSLGSDTTSNANGNTFVTWNWKAGTSVSGNTSGSGTSKAYTGSVSTTAGFSIIEYIGNGTAGHTIPHHLGAVPKMIIMKRIDAAGGSSGLDAWQVYHHVLGNTKRLVLNSTAAEDASTTYFNDTTPTSSVFTVGTGPAGNNTDYGYVAYSFSEVPNYSKFGTHTGNGNVNGPFVYTGFKPAFLMIKDASGSGEWLAWDNKRSPINEMTKALAWNDSLVEDTTKEMDFLSNGFKIRTTDTNYNASGNTNIYMAFAENPFVTSTANGSIPATAR